MSADEYIGDPDTWERLVHPDDVAEALGAWKAALAARRPWSLEYGSCAPRTGASSGCATNSTLARMTTAPCAGPGVMYDITKLQPPNRR